MKSRKTAFIILLLAAATVMFLAPTPVPAAGVLKVYTHTDISENEKWVPAAEKAIGAKIEWSPRMSSNELWSRVEAEAPNFQADVIWGFMNMQAMIGAAKGTALITGLLRPLLTPIC